MSFHARPGRATILVFSLLSFLFAACGNPLGEPASGKLNVIATYSILGDLAQNVGGDKVDARTLVGPDGDAHTFAPSPADGAALIGATVVFENGLEFEPWLDDLYASSDSKATRVVVTDGIEPRMTPEEPGHSLGESDPHVWHSVANVIHMTRNIRDALAGADPANAATYAANAEAYIAKLQELDTWIFEQVKTLPEARRKLVTSHDTFGYFAERYGFEIVGAALESASTETADPSASDLAALVDEIKAVGVPAIFAENVHNPKLMAQVAAEAGVTLAPQLYTDALGRPGSDGSTYLDMMRYNVITIVTELGK
ncbi:MAG: zinc ABC transporter substrate-binding protein [Chloroflexi bacterium]|nr:zinc ABC transporter substrate-binding protein [Chloroflexota bacterium]